MANHIHGYHGSTKDLCIYCGSGADETEYCAKHSDEEGARNERKRRRLELARQAKSKLTELEWEALYWTLTTDDRYSLNGPA